MKRKNVPHDREDEGLRFHAACFQGEPDRPRAGLLFSGFQSAFCFSYW
jgi:hypothetical protein